MVLEMLDCSLPAHATLLTFLLTLPGNKEAYNLREKRQWEPGWSLNALEQ